MTQYSSEPDDLVHNPPKSIGWNPEGKACKEFAEKCLPTRVRSGKAIKFVDHGQPDMQLSRQGEELANKHPCPNWDKIIGPCGHMKCPRCGPKLMKEAGRLLDELPIPTEGRQLHPKTDLE